MTCVVISSATIGTVSRKCVSLSESTNHSIVIPCSDTESVDLMKRLEVGYWILDVSFWVTSIRITTCSY